MTEPYSQGSESITQAEHISPVKTGDNIQAKRVVPYAWDGTSWGRTPLPFITASYDFISQAQASTTDTWTFKTGGSGGTTVATITITYTDSTKAVISTVART